MSRDRTIPTRPAATIHSDLRAAESRLAELRRDPRFILCGSDVETEHRWTARRLAVLRSELAAVSPERPWALATRY